MRILCISDSHGSTRNVEKAIDNLNPDMIIFTGDGAGEIENLSYIYDNIPFHIVKGNCDYGEYETSELFEVRSKRIFITHGHFYNVKLSYNEIIKAANNYDADIVVFGHTHIAYQNYINGLFMLNPGSISGKGVQKPSCAYIDIVGNSVLTNIVYF